MSADIGSFGQYLAQALGLLRSESPVHFQATRQRLGGLAILIRIAGDVPVRVRLEGEVAATWVARADHVGGHAHVGASDSGVEISTSRADLDGFLRGAFTLEEGLEANRLTVRGALDDVLAFLEALNAWLHGALRCPSFPSLHRRFLAGDRPPPAAAN
jgi:hypothetical protein